MTRYILAIDQGTTSSRAVLYDEKLRVVSSGQRPFEQHFPKADWVEHDLEEIWQSVVESIKEAVGKAPHGQIAAIGITNQRETFGLWERASGKPLGRAIVWQCRRSAKICEQLRKTTAGKRLAQRTGLVLDPYFSGTKLRWRLENEKDLAKKDLAFGTIDTWLLWKLSGGRIHKTDVTNASRTLLMDLKSCEWSDEALKTLKVPRKILPEICDSDAEFGATQGLGFLPDGIPLRGVLGDQQAALYGQDCSKKGQAKLTFGTGAFYLINTGEKICRTKSGVSTVAWRTRGQKTVYALEGSVFIAGAAVQWLRDGLKMIEKSGDITPLAQSVENSDGVFFIPALSGLGAPDWFPDAKGLIGGLTRRSTRAHLARATLEGIAASIGDGFGTLVKDSGEKLKALRVDGGAAVNDVLVQEQADVLQAKIERPQDLESTARGAATLAARSLGIKIDNANPVEKSFAPERKAAEAKARASLWRRRVDALKRGAY